MKKLFMLVLTLASFVFVVPSSETGTASAATVGAPQIQIQVGQRRRYRNRRWRRFENRGERIGYGRVYTTTRLVQRGYRTYRETYRVMTLPNGRTQATLISRVRVY
jgi:hypothetical protein